ncbi:MAG: thiamine pyrophosphate-dependent dehydrogenase E1 component subunit alpha [Halieaceae bacterium]|nr:thiamine pyrophosphate-dependent dehydrogenase E1 component subunit alpha [Halieaceae bacterium]
MDYSLDEITRAYRLMKTIREFEERIRSEYQQGKMPGFIHMYRNQEAIAVGACLDMTNDDYIASTHRGHGHCIAKGCELEGMMLELACKQDGLCNGKGGSMHIADMTKGMLGANAIVGGGPPIAAGAALTAKTLKTGGVSMAFIGDGASDQGTVAEALNLAVVLQLPMIFMYENNFYAEFTRNPKPEGRIAERAGAFGMPSIVVDGSDFYAVHAACREAIERGRSGGGPTAIEAVSARYYGHFEGDPQDYRDGAELRAQRAAGDPLPRFLEDPRTAALNVNRIADIDRAVFAELDRTVELAFAAADPTPDKLYTDVYVDYEGRAMQ